MATKEDISSEINEKLGTDMEWERMKKDELEHLNMMVDNGMLIEVLVKHMAKNKGSEKVDEIIDDWRPGKLAAKLV